ncbi:MAG: amidohydrolase family protein [Saprospiraceae bacterium]|nr:amidohydrolase family protein [Saprospiraceae bacterium]
MKTLISLFFLILLMFSVSAQSDSGDILIDNGTILTVTNGVLRGSDILIRDGKIHKIAKNIEPGNARVIDAGGLYVLPGIIDAHSHIAIDAVNEASNPVTAEVWVGDALDPYDISIYRALAGGVTISHAMHGSANAIGGQCETIKHRWGVTDPDDLRMDGAPRTIKFALGENPIRVHGEGKDVVPNTRMGVEQVFRHSFSKAREYMIGWEKFRNGHSKTAPQYSLRLETLADILKGDIIIHCHSYRADEILMLMNVLKDYGVNKICFQHVNEGFKVAPELAAFGAHASVFSDWWAYKFEVYYSTAYNAAILTRNGVVTSINSDSGELIRHLYHEAAKAQKYGGLTDEQTLALITLNPAIQLGIDDRVGSIEEGKDADIAIFKNHPLSIYAINQYTIVDGEIRFNIHEDEEDQRIDINPEETIPAFYEATEAHDHEAEGCMQGVYEFLFEHKH